MANPWLRLWADMPNDPKWRTIARVSNQEISRVMSVYLHMLVCASNATERGRTQGWCDEDIATALDIETDDVIVIREAMQGRVLDGDYLIGWEKRQPLREDGSADRGKAFRERQKQEKEEVKTQPNATERNRTLEEIREEEKRLDKKELKSKTEASPRGARLDSTWIAPNEFIDYCKENRPDLNLKFMEEKFRDYWSAKPGKDGRKTDWLATWRNFVKSERTVQARASPGKPEKFDPTAYVNRNRNEKNERTISFDATGEPV
jgi:hypothetical protein